MKKIFFTLLTCIIIVICIMLITRSGFLFERLVKDISIEDIHINDLEISNNTYYYEKLNKSEKDIYRTIANGVMNLKKNITIDVTKEDNYDRVKTDIEVALNAFFADHPEVFFVNDKYEISIINALVTNIVELKLNYISDNKTEIDSMKEEMNAKIQEINSKLTKAKTNYEKELLIHDILASSISYYAHTNYDEIPNIKHTAYGALVENSAVCDGITKAFQIILDNNNIESVFVSGTTDNIAHAWCKVKLDNDWYNVDLTSDKTLNATNKDLVIHSYFNVTDKEILKTHMIDNNKDMPSCTANKYNYYVYNNYIISYLDNFEYQLEQIANHQSAKALLEFNVTGVSNVPEKMVEALYKMNFNNYKTNNITKVQYSKINDNYIIVK